MNLLWTWSRIKKVYKDSFYWYKWWLRESTGIEILVLAVNLAQVKKTISKCRRWNKWSMSIYLQTKSSIWNTPIFIWENIHPDGIPDFVDANKKVRLAQDQMVKIIARHRREQQEWMARSKTLESKVLLCKVSPFSDRRWSLNQSLMFELSH